MAAVVIAARGQTQVDLRTQGKNIDFSTAASTRPSKTGTSLPAACFIGETFLKTDAAAGKNFYVCTASSVWTVQGVEVPNPMGKSDQVLSNDGTNFQWQALGGDIGGRPGAIAVTGLSGRKLGSLAPLDGQFLKWNGAMQQWEPTTLAGALSVFGRTGAIAAQTGDYGFPQISGTIASGQLPAAAGDLSGSLPGPTVVKIQSRPVSATTPLAGQFLGWDGAQWAPQTATGGVTSMFGRIGIVSAQSGDYSFSQISGTVGGGQLPATGGDLSGVLSNATVTQMQGRAVSATAPSSGQFLGWNGSQWLPQTPAAGVASMFGRTGAVTGQSGDYTFSQIGGTVGLAQLPSTGGDLSGVLTSATVGRIQNRPIAATPPSTGHVLTWDGAQWGPSAPSGLTSMFGRTGAVTAQAGDYSFGQISGTVTGGQLPATSGDLSGFLSGPTVVRIQNRPVAVTSPSTGQVLVWDGAQWTPQTIGGGVASTFGRTGAITAQTGDYGFGQISGSVTSGQLPATGGDLSGTLTGARVTGLQSRPVATSVPVTGAVLTWDGAQWAPQTFATAGVTSLFGRVGAVASQTGDYAFAQISGSVASAQLPSASGDLSGALGTPTVAGIQNRPVASSTPGVGHVLTWNGSQWSPQAQSGGVTSTFGRTGAITAQTGDYGFGQISGSVASGQLPATGGDLSGTLTGARVTGLQSRPVAASVPATGAVLTWDGAQWTPQTFAASAVTSLFGRVGAVASQTGDYAFAQISGTEARGQLPATGGDLSGTLTGARVTGLQSRPVATSVPATGAVLTWDGAQWTPQTVAATGVTSMFGRVGTVASQTGDYAFAQISGSVASGQLPAAGGDLSGTLASATVSSLQNRPMAGTAPTTGQVLAWSGSQWAPQPQSGGVTSMFGRTGVIAAQTGDYSFGQISGNVATGQLPGAGGDLTGTLASATVSKLQNRPMAAGVPATGQVLTWDGTQWTPQAAPGGTGGGPNLVDKTVGNTYTAGAKQIFGPSLATSGMNVTPGTLPTNAASGDVAIDSGDGNKLKVYDGAQWNTLISISNYTTTFTSVALVTVNGTTHRLGTGNLIVDCYDNSSPSTRVEPDKVVIDPLVFNVSIYFASPQTGHCVITGSSGASAGGGGAGMASQLGDLGLVLTSPTVLTSGLNCSTATPCNVRLGNTVYSVTSSSTITLSAGTGAVNLYVDASGALTAGHNLTLACAGVCAAVGGIGTFPPGSIPLYTWTASNGTWDTSGGSDKRAFLSTRSLSGGSGIVALDTGTQSIVAVDSATVPTYLTATAVLDFAGIAAGACAETTFPLPGASAGDSVAPGWPAGLEGGLMGMMRISEGSVVAVRVCNLSGTTVDPAAATFRATVVRSF